MASFAGSARFMVLLQIALFVVSVVITSSSVCLGAVQDIGRGSLDPNRPVCPPGRPCGRYPTPHFPYPYPYPGRRYPPYSGGAPPPTDGGIGRPRH